MRLPERVQRLRLAQLSLLFTIAAASLLWCIAVALDVVDGRHREQMAALMMPCAGDVPDTEVAVIRDVLLQVNLGRAPVLYERTTADGSGFISPPDRFPRQIGPPQAWQDYVTKNYQPRCIPANALSTPILRTGEFRRSHQERFWPWFHRRMGIHAELVRVSRVGFSADLKEAIVAVGRSCGGLCGQGALVRARWNGTRWELAELLPTWIS